MPVAFALSPLLVVAFGAMLLMLAEAFSTKRTPLTLGGPLRTVEHTNGLAMGATLVLLAGAAFAASVWMYGVGDIDGLEKLSPWLTIDRFSLFFDVLLCVGGALAALLAGGYLPEHHMNRGEFYALLLFSTLGAMMLASAGDLVTIFIGLETMSIGVYALTAFRRTSTRSAEGALKYFLLGSFAAALLLYGFALLYGATGHTDLVGIGASLKTGAVRDPMVIVALALVLA